MKVLRYKTAVDFLERAGAWLEQAEAENNLIFGIATYFKSYSGQLTTEPHFLTIEDRKIMVGVALMTPPRRLLLTSMPCGAVTTLADYLFSEGVPVPGVLGPKTEAELFSDVWTHKTGRSCRPKMSQQIYECTSVVPRTYPPGRLRPAVKDDEALLSVWCVRFCIDAGIEDEAGYFKARLPHKIADQSMFVWETDVVVSMAAVERQTAHGAAISWVYTPPHARRQGYATSHVAALTQRMLDSGKTFCCLYTDLSNPTSNSIYQKIGYRPICDVQDWIFE
jgi:predicted GNAT family acetyltransferase